GGPGQETACSPASANERRVCGPEIFRVAPEKVFFNSIGQHPPFAATTKFSGKPSLTMTRALARHPPHDIDLPQRLERRAHLRREELRLFPRREVPALVRLVEVGEL